MLSKRWKGAEKAEFPRWLRGNEIPEEQETSKAVYKRPPIHSRIKKGVSGNPGGVKRGTIFISEAYMRLLVPREGEL